jgi:hypothetical protein
MVYRGGHSNRVKRRVFRPALVSVTAPNQNIIVVKPLEIAHRAHNQLVNYFDCEDLCD